MGLEVSQLPVSQLPVTLPAGAKQVLPPNRRERSVVLTVNLCWGLKGLHRLHFQSPVWELREVGWEILGCEQAAGWLFPVRRAAVVLTLQPLCCTAGGSREKLWFAVDDRLESACNKSPVILVPLGLKACWKAGWESPKKLD